MEIDFLLSNESKTKFRVFPVEVKSSKNYTTSLLNGFKKKFGKKMGKATSFTQRHLPSCRTARFAFHRIW